MAENVFSALNSINVNEHTEKKKSGMTTLTYLSWPWAVAEVKKRYPDFSYEIERFDRNLPYVYDDLTGYMVFTKVTIEGVTHQMWLPVMDANNRAMKAEPYQITFGNGKTITVAAATMFDINKTIMRCLVKNMAMFGLGLYIYAGEDLPEETDDPKQEEPKKEEPKKAPAKKAAEKPAKKDGTNPSDLVRAYIKRHNYSQESISQICRYYKVENINELDELSALNYIDALNQKGKNINE